MFGIIKLAIDGIIILNDKLNTMEANRKSCEYVEGHRDDFRVTPRRETEEERRRKSRLDSFRWGCYMGANGKSTENPFAYCCNDMTLKKEKFAVFKGVPYSKRDRTLEIWLKEGYIAIFDTMEEANEYAWQRRKEENLDLLDIRTHSYFVLPDGSDPWRDRKYTLITRKNNSVIELERDDKSIDYEVFITVGDLGDKDFNSHIRCREI